MKSDDYEHSNDDEVEFEDCILAIEDGRDGCNIQGAADNFVVVPKTRQIVQSKNQ